MKASPDLYKTRNWSNSSRITSDNDLPPLSSMRIRQPHHEQLLRLLHRLITKDILEITELGAKIGPTNGPALRLPQSDARAIPMIVGT